MSNEEIKYHKYLNSLVVIKNSINIICFTILSIYFKKWWIIFGAILFTVSVEKKGESNE